MFNATGLFMWCCRPHNRKYSIWGYFSPSLVETRQEDKLCYKKVEINSSNKRRVKGQKVAMPMACPSFCPFSSTTYDIDLP